MITFPGNAMNGGPSLESDPAANELVDSDIDPRRARDRRAGWGRVAVLVVCGAGILGVAGGVNSIGGCADNMLTDNTPQTPTEVFIPPIEPHSPVIAPPSFAG